MNTINIDSKPYDLDALSEEAKSHLNMMQATDVEIQRLNLQLAIAQTARNAYASALKQKLPTPLEQTLAQGETLKLG